jgi:hypothetical protein
MEHRIVEQSAAVHQWIGDRLAEADAERLAHVVDTARVDRTAGHDTLKQRLGHGLISLGAFIASEPRPATDRR